MPINLKGGGGGAISCLHVSTENIGEDQKKKKKGLHVFRRPIYPPKSSEDQKKKSQRVLRCPVSTDLLTADIAYISLYFSGRRGATPAASPPGYAPA